MAERAVYHPWSIVCFVDLLNKSGADARQERVPAACGGGAPVAVAD
jgi:hypothetical protein